VHLLGEGDPFGWAPPGPEVDLPARDDAAAGSPLVGAIESLRQEMVALRRQLDEVRTALGMDPSDP
jgi:hypothetical protein